MDDNTLFGYEFKFQRITRLFFGSGMNYNLWGSDNALFKEIENVLKTGLYIAIHDNVLKNYSEYPERELMIRKARAVDLLGKISILMTTDFLKLSDDNGRPNAERNKADRKTMEMYVTSDKLAERLLPMFFIFRKELFVKSNLSQYVKFCLLFLGKKKRFLRIDNWNKFNIETPNYDFYDLDVVALGQESSKVFKKVFDVQTNERSFRKEDLYRIENGEVVSWSTDRRAIMDLQMFIRSLVNFYLGNDKLKIAEALSNYTTLIFRAELIVAYEMAEEMNRLAFIKK